MLKIKYYKIYIFIYLKIIYFYTIYLKRGQTNDRNYKVNYWVDNPDHPDQVIDEFTLIAGKEKLQLFVVILRELQLAVCLIAGMVYYACSTYGSYHFLEILMMISFPELF